jgi:hypothetical protein
MTLVALASRRLLALQEHVARVPPQEHVDE